MNDRGVNTPNGTEVKLLAIIKQTKKPRQKISSIMGTMTAAPKTLTVIHMIA